MLRTEVELTVQDDDDLQEDSVTTSSQKTTPSASTSLEELWVSLPPVALKAIERARSRKNLFKQTPMTPSISKETLHKN